MAQTAKAKKVAKEAKEGKGDAFKAEEVLQAIIIADSFNERFKPLTLQTPRALLPVVNCPTIEYTLDFLAGVGVNEIMIFCRAHAEKIRNFIESHWKWGSRGRRHRSVSVQVIVSENCYSMGDALREIDAKNTIRGDFILVQGDLVANVELKTALDAHRKRRTTDKESIMTIVCRQVASRHPARSIEDQVVLTVDPASNRVLHYQKMGPSRKVQFPVDILEGRDDIEIRCDLIDCHISICSPQVPPLFSDNFDYLTRDDFIRGILVNEEVLGNTIHCHFLTAGYTARISNLHMYDVISRDIIARWVYPYCADLGFPVGDAYFYKRHHIYYQKDVQLARGCVLEENVLVGKETTIGENTKIKNSVIGNNCRIGANCVIEGSYIWDNCNIGENCQLWKSIVAAGCKIRENSIVNTGGILSYDVTVGPDATIPPGARIIGQQEFELYQQGLSSDIDLDHGSFDVQQADEAVVGKANAIWTFEIQEHMQSEDESDITGLNFEKLNWKWTSQENLHAEDHGIEDSSDDDSEDLNDAEEHILHPVDDTRLFFNEISDSLMRTVEERNTDNVRHVLLEINSSKFAYNVTMDELNKLVIRSIIEIPEIRARTKRKEFKDAGEVAKEVVAVMEFLKPVLQNYYKSPESQMDALYALEECVVNYMDLSKHQPYGSFLMAGCPKILHCLYNLVLTEDVIMKWYQQPVKAHIRRFIPFFLHEISQNSPRRRQISGELDEEEVLSLINKIEVYKLKIQPLIKWLEEAEEESGEE